METPQPFSHKTNPRPAPPAQAAPLQTVADQIIGPDYANAPETMTKDDVPKGFVYEFMLNSEDSKIYPGIAKNQPGVVPYQRKVVLYIPRQYVPGTPAPFIVAQDGLGYRGVLPNTLDNLIAQKRVPVMLAILINSGGGDAQGSERGLEYDTVSPPLRRIYRKRKCCRISRTITMSPLRPTPKGGRQWAARRAGRRRLQWRGFARICSGAFLTYSGTYVNQQSPFNAASPHGAWEYHEHFIKDNPKKPLRIWLEVSENDNGAKRDEASLHNWVMANERMGPKP